MIIELGTRELQVAVERYYEEFFGPAMGVGIENVQLVVTEEGFVNARIRLSDHNES